MILTDKTNPAAPTSNTGHKSQNGLTLGIDWVSGHCKLAGHSDYYLAVSTLEKMCQDAMTHHDAIRLRNWQRSTTQAYGQRGLQTTFDADSRLFTFTLSGKACAAAGLVELVGWLEFVNSQTKPRITRLDLSCDDHDRQLDLDVIQAEGIAGNYAKAGRYHCSEKALTKGGKVARTVYFGAPSSDKMTRFYDKGIESNGEIDAIRVEIQLRKEKAQDAADAIINVVQDRNSSDDIAILVGRFMKGSLLTFCENTGEKNVGRRPVLPWWAAFLGRLIGEAVKPPVRKAQPLFAKTMEWIRDQVAPTLAVASQIYGDGLAMVFDALVDEGLGRLNSRHRAMIRAEGGLAAG